MENPELDRIRFVTRHFNDLQGLRHWVPLGLITLGLAGVPFRAVLYVAAVLLALAGQRYYRNVLGEVEPQPAFPAGDFPSLSLYPAAPMAPLEASRLMPEGARRFLITFGWAMVLFAAFHAVNPNILVGAHASTLDSVDEAEPDWARGVGNILSTAGNTVFMPAGQPNSPRVMLAQMILVLYGSLFLTLWLWRDRASSHRHDLALAALLLGLAAFGSFLGYFVYEEREIPRRIIDFLLPVLVHPQAALTLCGIAVIATGLYDHWQLTRALRRPVEVSP